MVSDCALSQDSLSDVTRLQIMFYQLDLQAGCKDAGSADGDSLESVTDLCNCMMKTLNQEMTHIEWQQAYLFSIRSDKDDMQVLNRHMDKARSCRNK